MDNNSRLVLFLISCVAVLAISQFFMPQPSPPPQEAEAVSQTAPTPGKNVPAVSHASTAVKAPAHHKTADVRAASVTVETSDYIATFSNEGALLTSFRLKKYLRHEAPEPIDLVNSDSGHPKPFSVNYAPMPDLDQKIFEVQGSSKKLSGPGEKASLTFQYVDENGTVLKKSFDFTNGSYLIGFHVSVAQTGSGSVPSSDLALGWADTLGKEDFAHTNTRLYSGNRVATWYQGKLDKETPKKSQEQWETPSAQWTALADQFFLAALIPDASNGRVTVRVIRDNNAYKVASEDNSNLALDPEEFTPRPILVFPGPALHSGESFTRTGQVYIGPQDYSILKGLGLQLEEVIDFGMFRFLSVPMLRLLQWFYHLVHNWGLSIILLSLLMKLILWYPTYKSTKHMTQMGKKMRELQPQLEALKKKHANDRQKLNQETILLQQKAGLNPLEGCLPMFLQMPVWIALYATLSHSIELRGASFVFWIKDLSLMDPYYVLPVVMSASMFAMQWMTSKHTPVAPAQANQQKVTMYVMPILFFTFLYKTPAGLQLYILLSNILSMIQNKMVYRSLEKQGS